MGNFSKTDSNFRSPPSAYPVPMIQLSYSPILSSLYTFSLTVSLLVCPALPQGWQSINNEPTAAWGNRIPLLPHQIRSKIGALRASVKYLAKHGYTPIVWFFFLNNASKSSIWDHVANRKVSKVSHVLPLLEAWPPVVTQGCSGCCVLCGNTLH